MQFNKILTMLSALLMIVYPWGTAHADSGFGWGFKKNDDHEIPDVGQYDEMLDDYLAYYADKSGEKVIYLTFDNGYESGYTDDILDVLQEKDVPATFFVTGHYAKSEKDLIKRMADEGHIIGNHSYHHPDLTVLTKKSMQEELESLEEEVSNVTEQEDMKYMRPPKGAFNQDSLKWAADLGYIHIFWSLAFVDWEEDEQKDWRYTYDQVMDQIHPGAIILLHTISENNEEALSKLIDDLREKDYTFKSLDDMVMKDMLPEAIYGF